MPRLRFHLSLSMYLVVAALVLIFASPLLAQPVAQSMTWSLSAGKVTPTDKGFELTATATAQGAAHVRTGAFSAKCTVEGAVMSGTWSITGPGAKKTVHSTAHFLNGNLSGAAVTDIKNFDATASVSPKRRHALKQAKFSGPFHWETDAQDVSSGTLTINKKQ